jgi:hypothetical protein
MTWKAQALLGAGLMAAKAMATCFNPEPDYRICYNVPGATPQNVKIQEIQFCAKQLRYDADVLGNKFWTMGLPDADNCGEWQVTTKGSTWILAKLVGDDAASISLHDLANTLDGGVGATKEQIAKSLLGCETAGGQMGVMINATNPVYQEPQFKNGTYTNKGIVIKIVRNPDVKAPASKINLSQSLGEAADF